MSSIVPLDSQENLNKNWLRVRIYDHTENFPSRDSELWMRRFVKLSLKSNKTLWEHELINKTFRKLLFYKISSFIVKELVSKHPIQ